jgi:pimeloyl-ACP methyl ester carboxylesterase
LLLYLLGALSAMHPMTHGKWFATVENGTSNVNNNDRLSLTQRAGASSPLNPSDQRRASRRLRSEYAYSMILPEQIDWRPFPASPPGERLTTLVGHPAKVGPYFVRVKAPPDARLILVVWGRYDPSFEIAGAFAYRDDVSTAEVHIVEAVHFALDEAADEIASPVAGFLAQYVPNGPD